MPQYTPASTGRDSAASPRARARDVARPRSNQRLNQPKKPLCSTWPPGGSGFRIVAHSAGVRISATSTDSAIADTSVMENCR